MTSQKDLKSLTIEQRRETKSIVYRLFLKNRTAQFVAEELDLASSTVYRWFSQFKKNGENGITEKKRGGLKIKPRRLSAEQEQQIQKDLVETTPDQYGMQLCLWNSRAIRDYINQKYTTTLSARTVRL